MIFSTKKVAKPGTYKCTSCGTSIYHTNEEKLIPCPNCENIKWEKLI